MRSIFKATLRLFHPKLFITPRFLSSNSLVLPFSTTKPQPSSQDPKNSTFLRAEDKPYVLAIQKGIEHMKNNRLQDSLQHFAFALNTSKVNSPTNHGNGLAYFYLATLHQFQGEYEKALDLFENCIENFLHAKADKKCFELPEAEIKKLHKNIADSVIEMEKKEYFGPLSHYIRKEAVFEDFENLMKTTDKSEETLREIGHVFFQMGDIHRIEKNDDCVEMKLKGVEYFEKLMKNEAEMLMGIYFDTGKFFNKMGKRKEAETYFLKALGLIEQAKPENKDFMMHSLHYKGLGVTYCQTEQFDKAIESMNISMKLIEGNLKEMIPVLEKASVYSDLVKILSILKREEEMVPLMLKYVKILEEGGQISMAARDYQQIANLFENLNRFAEAKEALEKSAALFKEYYGDKHEFTKTAEERLSKFEENHKKK